MQTSSTQNTTWVVAMGVGKWLQEDFNESDKSWYTHVRFQDVQQKSLLVPWHKPNSESRILNWMSSFIGFLAHLKGLYLCELLPGINPIELNFGMRVPMPLMRKSYQIFTSILKSVAVTMPRCLWWRGIFRHDKICCNSAVHWPICTKLPTFGKSTNLNKYPCKVGSQSHYNIYCTFSEIFS